MSGALLSLRARGDALASTDEQRRLLETTRGIPAFDARLQDAGRPPLAATGVDVLQVNVGRLCNQTCRHCHVDAGPDRREVMTQETAELCIRALGSADVGTLDITGGAPELNPSFRYLVEEARRLGRHVMDRCNLTVLLTASHEDLPEFLAAHRVEVVASLPYYRASQTDAQRGARVFERSIEALQRLNSVGYGQGAGLVLNLVTNPVGAFLPARQEALEAQFRRELLRQHGVTFDRLYTITNMPISRFLEFLLTSGNYEAYMQKLVQAFNPVAADGVMCRTMVSVGWDGQLYDCDFNQMLDLGTGFGAPGHIRDFDPERLASRRIVTGRHCYGCTAGAGSSCGGATA